VFRNDREHLYHAKLLLFGGHDLARAAYQRLKQAIEGFDGHWEAGVVPACIDPNGRRWPTTFDLRFPSPDHEWNGYGLRAFCYALAEAREHAAALEFLLPGTDAILFAVDARVELLQANADARALLDDAIVRLGWRGKNVIVVVTVLSTSEPGARSLDELVVHLPEHATVVDVDAIDQAPDSLPGMYLAQYVALRRVHESLQRDELVNPP
jgi:hypothetical protein